MSLLAACNSNGETASGQDQADKPESSIKLRQYIVQGRQLYIANCSNCHQKDGTGLGKLIPPLAGADYLSEDVERTVCIIKNGIEGEITVNGQVYNQPMPANPKLTPLEIAEITTYLYNSWGLETGLKDVKSISNILNDCEK